VKVLAVLGEKHRGRRPPSGRVIGIWRAADDRRTLKRTQKPLK